MMTLKTKKSPSEPAKNAVANKLMESSNNSEILK